MKRYFLFLLAACAFALSVPASAQDGKFKLFGSIGTGVIGAEEDAQDAAKLHEYRDLTSGPFGVFEIRGRGTRAYFDAFGENLGRDDMYMSFQGGVYGQFKFRLFGNWLTHNFGFGPFGARTPFQDPGETNLQLFSTTSAALANSNVPPWKSFDFKVDRRDIGGSFEFNAGSPWYVLFETNEVHQEGINKVDAAALGTSPGNGFIDLPYSLHYTTYNLSAEAGYQKPRGHISVNMIHSDFKNDNTLLQFQNPFFGFGTDVATFAPNNDYVRIGVNGMLRQLPLNSTLSARLTYDKNTDRIDMIDSVLNTSGAADLTATNPSSPTFHGKVENVTSHISYELEPIRHLDVRVFYHLYWRRNSSTEIEFLVPLTTAGLVCSAPSTTSADTVNIACVSERYGYTKHNPGVEADYRFTPENRLNAGFDYLNTSRNRFDANRTRDKKVFIQWSNTSLDILTARIKYQYLQRRSDFLTNNVGFNANSLFYLERFNRSFDVADLNQHLVKADFDVVPIKFLDFAFEAYYKKNNYKNFILGRLNDDRKEFYGSVSYGDPTKFRATLFGDIEYINYRSYHRTINASACTAASPNCFDPRTAPTATAYNWRAKVHDKNWTVEFAADWPINEHFVLKGSALVQETRGGVDFQSQTLTTGSPAALLFPINAYDNTRRRSVNPRVVYTFSGNTELTVGYAYEKYRYKDAQYDGYRYTIGSGASTSYLSGIYAFPNYRADIVYGTVRYLF
jgi:hypothetical protein